MDQIKRPKLLTELVLNYLRELIVQGDLKLGETISERQLTERLKVSKTPIREAIKHLMVEGLVEADTQKGARVFTLSADEVGKICSFRQILETAALTLALKRAKRELILETSEIVNEMHDAQTQRDFRRYLALDTRFHLTPFKHCDNRFLAETYSRHAGKIEALRTHMATKPMHTNLSMTEHQALLLAFTKDSHREALDMLEAHIDRIRRTYSQEITNAAPARRALLQEC
nr:GntR family transcriptional regulator [uncultured Cohaesibacter sp.]